MNTEKFIIDKLEKFIKDFSKVRVRYEYDEMSRSHFIEIVPNTIFHSDNDLKKWECTLLDKFVTYCPTENICFISDDDLFKIENIIYIKEGLDYAPVSTVVESVAFDPLSILLQQSTTKEVFNITFAETKVDSLIETTIMTYDYLSQTYLKAA